MCSSDLIKQLKNSVDVLTMTATPIPRTLHMSIVGVRDMSVIYEPPQARKPVQTYVLEYDQDVIKEAIEVNGLTTVEDITNYTKAGGACGRCKKDIQALIDKYAKKSEPKLSPAQLILKINKVIENVIAPELQKDGGDIELVDIDDNKVYVKLQGRCSSCKNSVLTLKAFVETTLKDKVSTDIEVIQV